MFITRHILKIVNTFNSGFFNLFYISESTFIRYLRLQYSMDRCKHNKEKNINFRYIKNSIDKNLSYANQNYIYVFFCSPS